MLQVPVHSGTCTSPSFGVTPEFSKPLCCMKLLYESWNPYLNGMTQWQLAQFLEQCGYRLYAIGSRSSFEATAEPVPMHALDSSAAGAVHREVPVLLRFNSSTYMDSLWCRFSRGQRKDAPPPTPQTTSIGSNTLAVAESAIQASPWLKTFLARHALV